MAVPSPAVVLVNCAVVIPAVTVLKYIFPNPIVVLISGVDQFCCKLE